MQILINFIHLSIAFCLANIYQFQSESLDGKKYDLKQLKGKVVIIVNTASKCGYTPQYRSLQDLYEKYSRKGLEILAYPSGDFGGQEFEDKKKIKSFCQKNYGVTFPVMSKSHVQGKNKNDVFKYLLSQAKDKQEVQWNFEKFIINQKGKVVARYKSNVDPLDKKITNLIDKEISM